MDQRDYTLSILRDVGTLLAYPVLSHECGRLYDQVIRNRTDARLHDLLLTLGGRQPRLLAVWTWDERIYLVVPTGDELSLHWFQQFETPYGTSPTTNCITESVLASLSAHKPGEFLLRWQEGGAA